MRRSLLPTYLKKIHPALTVVRHSNRGEHIYHGGSDAVYFYTNFIGAVPPGNIYRQASELYRDKYRHRSLIGLINRLHAKGILWGHKLEEARRDLSNW